MNNLVLCTVSVVTPHAFNECPDVVDRNSVYPNVEVVVNLKLGEVYTVDPMAKRTRSGKQY